MMNSDNVRKAGRPNKTFQMNLNNIPQTLAEVDSICQNKKTRAIVKDFASTLQNMLSSTDSVATRTKFKQRDSLSVRIYSFCMSKQRREKDHLKF